MFVMFLEDLEILIVFSRLLTLHLHGSILDGFSGQFHFVFGFKWIRPRNGMGHVHLQETAPKKRSNGMRTDRIHSKTTLHGKNHVFLCLLPGKG